MNIGMTTSVGGGTQPKFQAADHIDAQRKNKEKAADTPQSAPEDKGVQAEELLSQIKAITENGQYSVRFEQNDNSDLIVKIFNQQTNEVVRQIPAEELLKLKEALKDLAGNIVDTQA